MPFLRFLRGRTQDSQLQRGARCAPYMAGEVGTEGPAFPGSLWGWEGGAQARRLCHYGPVLSQNPSPKLRKSVKKRLKIRKRATQRVAPTYGGWEGVWGRAGAVGPWSSPASNSPNPINRTSVPWSSPTSNIPNSFNRTSVPWPSQTDHIASHHPSFTRTLVRRLPGL